MAATPTSRPPPETEGLTATRFAVVDVETNGLRPRRDRVIQLAVVTVRGDGVEIDRWVTDVRPPRDRVGPAEVHGITPERLRGAPPFRAVAPQLVGRLDGAVLVAHNAGFDWTFLRNELGRIGYPAPSPRRLDTLRLSRELDPDRLLGHSLGDVTVRYGIANGHAHDALADADATARLLPLLLEATGISTADQLRPHLWGHDDTWPPFATSRRAALRWWLHRLRPRPVRRLKRLRYRLLRTLRRQAPPTPPPSGSPASATSPGDAATAPPATPPNGQAPTSAAWDDTVTAPPATPPRDQAAPGAVSDDTVAAWPATPPTDQAAPGASPR